MSERERLARREFQEEQAVVEKAERLERERPLREAETQLQRTAAELGKVERENILSMPDPEFTISESVIGKRMSLAEAREFNAMESQKFLLETPSYFACEKNFRTIIEYLDRNGVAIADSATFKTAYDRLQALGLLEERPVSEPEPIPTPTLVEADELPKEANTFSGYDPKTGLAKDYTSREVADMSSSDYKKVFRLFGSRAPVFIDPRL